MISLASFIYLFLKALWLLIFASFHVSSLTVSDAV